MAPVPCFEFIDTLAKNEWVGGQQQQQQHQLLTTFDNKRRTFQKPRTADNCPRSSSSTFLLLLLGVLLQYSGPFSLYRLRSLYPKRSRYSNSIIYYTNIVNAYYIQARSSISGSRSTMARTVRLYCVHNFQFAQAIVF